MLVEPGTDSYLPTRQSLLSRLRDLQDEEGWSEFFDLYWRLIYNVARKSGLADAEAQDVVQQTFLYLSRRMVNFCYHPERGSFKSWLRVVTRSRIAAYRRRENAGKPLFSEPLPTNSDDEPDALEKLASLADSELDRTWQREWEEHLINTATRRVRSKISSQQLLIFRLATSGELPLGQVAKKLGVSLAQVYLARHRVGRMLKAEIDALRRQSE